MPYPQPNYWDDLEEDDAMYALPAKRPGFDPLRTPWEMQNGMTPPLPAPAPARPPLDMRAPLPEDNNPYSYARLAARPAESILKPPFPVAPAAEAAMPEQSDPIGWETPPQLPTSPMPAPPKMKRDWIDAEDPFVTDWNSAAAKRDAHILEKPKLGGQEYERPMWQKALMTGANAFAGFINAGRRTHVDPISEKQILRRPKYEAAMDAWETKGKSLDSQIDSMQKQYNLKRQRSQDDLQQKQFIRQQDLTEAQIGAQEAHGRYYDAAAAAAAKEKALKEQADMNLGWAVWNPRNKGIYPNSIKPTADEKQPNTIEAALIHGTPEQKAAAQAVEDKRLAARAKKGGGRRAGDDLTAYQTLQRQDKIDAKTAEYDKLEQGNPLGPDGQTPVPGLHQRAREIGEKIKAGKDKKGNASYSDSDIEQYNAIRAKLREIYKFKFDNGKISREQYDAYSKGVEGDWKPWEPEPEKPKTETPKAGSDKIAGAKPEVKAAPTPAPQPAATPAALPRGQHAATSRGQGPPTTPPDPQIQIKRPDGSTGTIPLSMWPKAHSLGAERI